MSISITPHLKHAQRRRGMAESFYADERQLGMMGRREAVGVFEADKNGNLPPFAVHHRVIKASCWSLGSNAGRRGERGLGGEERVGEMSQLCLTGLRAELCGLMLRERGWSPPSPRKNTHTQGKGAEKEEQLEESLVTASWVTCQQALTRPSLT